jgi:hypothetical protein
MMTTEVTTTPLESRSIVFVGGSEYLCAIMSIRLTNSAACFAEPMLIFLHVFCSDRYSQIQLCLYTSSISPAVCMLINILEYNDYCSVLQYSTRVVYSSRVVGAEW